MKSIVFDNAGTILKRVTVLNDVINNKLIYETDTIGIVNQKSTRIIVVLQEDVGVLSNTYGKISNYLANNPDKFEISYSKAAYDKKDVISVLDNSNVLFNQLTVTIQKLIDDFEVEIISGCALIMDMDKKQIEYVYTAGGLFFKDTRNVINFINDLNMSIYIASGDNKPSLTKIASILNIPLSNVHSTCDMYGKLKVVKSLQEKGNFVYMVGNHTNDKLALKQADVGILTTEQGEDVPIYLKKTANHVINSIGEVINILKMDNEA